jgi:Arc/MetJ family transcription regulator
MRTTINLPDDLLTRVKKMAAEGRTTVTAFVEEALREKLGRRREKARSGAVRLTTYGKAGLQPGVDLDDSAALLDLMEPTSAPR